MIWSATFVALVLVFMRATAVIVWGRHRERHYPPTWTPQQIERLQFVRSYIGIILMVAWAGLLAASSFLPARYPFSQSSAVLFIALLVQTYAFLVMIVPPDLNGSPIARLKFEYVLRGTVLWWVIFLGITIYLIVALSAPMLFPREPVIRKGYA